MAYIWKLVVQLLRVFRCIFRSTSVEMKTLTWLPHGIFYILLLFHLFSPVIAAGNNNSFIGWTILIVFGLVVIVLFVLLLLNPEFAWACWYCLKDLVRTCCPNVATSQCRGSINNNVRPEVDANSVEVPLPVDDEPPPPYEVIFPQR